MDFLEFLPYEWTKALHIISVITWMAGIFYLPRLFVYHAMSEVGSEKSEIFKVMERKLLKGIMNPSLIASWIFGLWLAFGHGIWTADAIWLHIKFLLVSLMTAYHMVCARYVRVFAADENRKDHVYYRYFNEVPTLLMVAIVILAVVKPFY
ncbi:putative membrane protein [Cohaesibacter marisflavi]|uniref:Protoporphyrinogen IX oxidase n=1 Tax=Cohaesibacter marisflavi TaxID=655353 RepID=A0A1I5GM19_9HYPH|nr:protoporphyrinogen oxidase HemJ [Cohaesibacter marisflavi]SFO37094.1 putative membrane protein [Cohaesibacter marisflavi]